MLWSAGLNLVRDVLQFGQMVVMARLLDPATYGKAGLAFAMINFIGLASFQHVVAHVLQIRGKDEVNFHLHFTAGVVLNGTLFLFANGIAFGLQYSPQYAPLQPLLHLLSLTFLIGVPAEMRTKMLERDHDWRRLRTLQLTGILISLSTAIVLAYAGAGVYALVVPGLLASTVVATDLFLAARWRPKWQWNYGAYRATIRFGINRASSNALNSGRLLTQNSLITQHAQFSGLGIFTRAEGLATLFCGRISQQIGAALYPIITRAEPASAQFQRISMLVLSSVVWVAMPIATFISLEAATVVRVLYGPKWVDVAPLLPLAMGTGFSICVGATAYNLLLANDQSRLCLRSDTIAFFVAIAPMLILIPFGLQTYLAGALAANIVIGVLLLALLIRTKGLKRRDLVNAIAAPAIATFLALCGTWMSRWLSQELSGVSALLLTWCIFTALYILVLRLIFKAALAEIVSYLPGGKYVRQWLRLGTP